MSTIHASQFLITIAQLKVIFSKKQLASVNIDVRLAFVSKNRDTNINVNGTKIQ